MFVDAAGDLLEAFRELEAGILDVQAEVDTLEAEMANERSRQAMKHPSQATSVSSAWMRRQ